MPEIRKKAEKEMEMLTPQIKTAIEQRFSNVSDLIDDVATRMRDEIPFPKALAEAVREKDPALAEEIERSLSKAPERTEEPEVPSVEAETAVSMRLGVSPAGPAAEMKIEERISVGENFSFEAAAGPAITHEESADVAADATMAIGNIEVGATRDPLTGTEVAGVAGAYFEIVPGLYAGAGFEVGLDTEGGTYVTTYPAISYEGDKLSAEVIPLFTVEPESAVGLEASAEYAVSDRVSTTAYFYSYEITAPEVTITVGAKAAF